MKKITLLITLFAFSLGFSQGGLDCGSSEVIPNTTTNATFTATINFGTGQMNAGAFLFSFYEFTPTQDGILTISSCGGGVNTSLFVGSGSCGSLTVEDSSIDDCGVESIVEDLVVQAGVTYIIEWSNDPSVFSGTFDWDFTFNGVSCFPPTDISIDFKTQTRVDFRFEAPLDGSSPSSYDWEIVPLGNAQGDGVVASGNSADNSPSTEDVGATLVGNTDYDIRVRSDCGGGDLSDWTAPFTFKTKETAPPANDTCFTAESVSIEGDIANAASATANPSTILGACFTTANAANQECFGGENPNDDVWFTFDAPDNTTFTITVETNLGPPNFDPTITLFDSTCDNLGAALDCDDPTAFDFAEITYTNNSGSTKTYYFRVYNFAEATPADPTFTYKLWSSATLSNDNFEAANDFKVFPNPVNDMLNIQSKNTIDSISVFNMLGQEVISVRTNSNSEAVSMSDLKTGTYFARITSNGVTETMKVLKR